MGESRWRWLSRKARRSSIRRRLIAWILILVLLPLVIIAILSFNQLRLSLIKETEQLLLDDLASAKAAVEGWVHNRAQDTSLLAINSEYATGTKVLQDRLAEHGSLTEFIHSDVWNQLSSELNDRLTVLKKHYDDIYDIYLIDETGNVLFSVNKYEDLGTNLNSGAFKNTHFAETFRQSIKNQKILFSDFAQYRSIDQQASGFFVAPLVSDSGVVRGALAIQVMLTPLVNILRHVAPNSPMQYLVGEDGALRTPIANGETLSGLNGVISTDLVDGWRDSLVLPALAQSPGLMSKSIAEYPGPGGGAVFGIGQNLELFNVRWLLVTEIKKDQVLDKLRIIGQASVVIAFIFATIVVVFVFSLTNRLMRPLEALAEAAENAADGKLDQEVLVESSRTDEIGRLARSFNNMLKARRKYEADLLSAIYDAKAANRAKSDFLACMSHEIRTPMNGVLGMLGLMKNSPLPAEQERKLSIAHNSARSLLSLINDILDFSKVEAGKLRLENIDFSISEQIVEVVQSFAIKAEEQNIDLILNLVGVDQLFVRGDPGRLRQIFTNLIGNALKFTEEGEVVVCAKTEIKENGKIELLCSVQDTGIGIPEMYQSHLFDSFTQLDASTTRKFGGTGLGLAICKNLCELMHGHISVESEEYIGSKFSFVVELGLSKNISAVTHPDSFNCPVRILLKENSKTYRNILKKQLELWGALVIDVETSEQALEQIDSHDVDFFHIAIVDDDMTEIDGMSLGNIIQQKKIVVPLVMLSSVSHVETLKNMASLQPCTLLVKPLAPSGLFNAIEQKMEAGQSINDELESSTRLKEELIPLNRQEKQWLKSSRILVVEDNDINQEVVVSMLADMNLDCDVAENGFKAISQLKDAGSPAFHLVFMDCQMPEMDGYEATRRIRAGEAGEQFKDIPIVAMTANAMLGDKQQCLDAGMNDYLSKPIDDHSVEAALNKWLPKAELINQTQPQAPGESAVATDELVLPSDLHTIDFSCERPDVARKAGTYLRLLKIYLKQNSGFNGLAAQFFEGGDLNKLRELVHTLKGASGSLGMTPVFESASEFEAVLREGETPQQNQFDQLCQVVEWSLGDAREIISQNSEDAAMHSSREFSDVCEEIINKLEQGLVIERDLVSDFESAAKACLSAESVEEFVGYLDSFDYDDALVFIKAIQA